MGDIFRENWETSQNIQLHKRKAETSRSLLRDPSLLGFIPLLCWYSLDLVMIAGSLSRSFLRFQNDQALCMNWTTNGHIWGCTPCLLAVKGMQLKTKLSLVGIIDCRQQDIVQQIKWNYQVGEKEEEGHAIHVVSILCVQKRSKSWKMKTFPFGISVSIILYTKLLKTRKKKTHKLPPSINHDIRKIGRGEEDP